jgi:excisionase family DNA binding protein
LKPTPLDQEQELHRLRESEHFSPAEVAFFLDVSPETIRRWLRAGIITGRRIGGRWRTNKEDLLDFVEVLAVFGDI